MSYSITQMLIPGLPKTGYRNGVGAFEGVVNHATDNTAPAINERNYEANGAWKNAFVHYFVDWTSIIQVADIAYKAWGAGSVANARYVHIELCQTSDPNLFRESYNRYVWLSAWVLAQRKLGVRDGGTLVSHDWVSKNLGGTNHTDPINYLASHGISWAQHVANVAAEYNCIVNPAPAVAPSTGGTYTVQNGDTLWGISRKFGVSVDQLKAWNGLADNTIHPGQVLRVAETPVAPSTFRIEVLAASLWYYSAPDWNAKKDLVHAGDIYTVVETLTVAGSKMYKLKSGTYITANPSFVKVL